jgi:hypothetical protein
VFPVKYKLGFYIPEDDILHSHSREILKSYVFNIELLLSISFYLYMCMRLSLLPCVLHVTSTAHHNLITETILSEGDLRIVDRNVGLYSSYSCVS